MPESIITTIFLIILGIALILILREFNCWYWKINKRIKLQEETNSLLQKLIEETKIEIEEKNEAFTPSKNDIDLNNTEILDKLLSNLPKKIS